MRRTLTCAGGVVVGLFAGLLMNAAAFFVTSLMNVHTALGTIVLVALAVMGIAWTSYKRHFDWVAFFVSALCGVAIFNIWFL
ncbi:hypothetical protein [Alicyclobacillus fastidiosus]|uniref:Uncharacterized protein n=1 Tax=Alicyclobacillus fastidiosus TaxID=392011 RepID=A0ABV5AD76_9BACL|nr:hypothetical protein [Alicyclobacillus fastidiosus]WEH08748.1 hypothetical protein PYS47_18965 [Alicyclobacillus fastidiosus]